MKNLISTNHNGQKGLNKEIYILSRGNRKFSIMSRETLNGKVIRDDFVYTGTKKRCEEQMPHLNHSILGL
jgi:hypothetical protein